MKRGEGQMRSEVPWGVRGGLQQGLVAIVGTSDITRCDVKVIAGV